MTTAVQHRRGSTSEHSTFTGLVGEVTIDTTKDTAVIHDGSLAGGYPLAKENLSNVTPTGLPTIDGASTASDDKFFIYDQSASVLKSITRAELNNAIEQDALANVAITGGTINGTSVGATTPSTGAFTTLSSSSTTILNGTTIPASKTLVTLDNTQTLTNKTLTSPVISGGSINNAAIGETTPAAGAFTTLTTSGAVTISGGTANGVAYLNGSKVLTTGSALTFDGTSTFKVNPATGVPYIRAESTQYSTFVQHFAASGATGVEYKTAYRFVDTDVGELMRLTSTGLGIGTSSPSAKLQVKDGTNINVRIGALGSYASVYSINDAGSAYQNLRIDATDLLLNTYSGGNVGIGTSSPSAKLHVSGGRTLAITGNESYSLGIGRESNTNAYYLGVHSTSNPNLLFSNNAGTTNMTLTYDGNFGLGVTPSAWGGTNTKSLDISLWTSLANGNAFGSALTFNGYYNGTNWIYKQTNTAAKYESDGAHRWYTAPSGTAGNAISFTQAMSLTAVGDLLVGTTSTTNNSRFACNNTAGTRKWGFGTQGSSTPFYVVDDTTGSGVQLTAGATAWSSFSDERNKTQLKPFENAIEKVCTLRSGTGRYLTDNESVSRSFLIAQDVQKVLPEAVSVSEDEQGTLTLRYTDLIPLLAAAIQEQQAIITDLRARVAALEAA